MKNTKITLRLPVALLERELLAIQDEAVAVNKEIDVLDMQKKRLGAKSKERGERLQELFVLMDEKTEKREVECQIFYDWSMGEKKLRRLDTYEQVGDTELIQERERQMHLSETGEVAPAGFGVTDDDLRTETDEKARVPFEPSNEVEKQEVAVCETCEGDGFYNDDTGEEYCQCPAGDALRAKDAEKEAAKTAATHESAAGEYNPLKCGNKTCASFDLDVTDHCAVNIDNKPVDGCKDYLAEAAPAVDLDSTDEWPVNDADSTEAA